MYSTVQATSPLMSALLIIKRTWIHIIFMESGLLQYCFQNISHLRNEVGVKNRVHYRSTQHSFVLYQLLPFLGGGGWEGGKRQVNGTFSPSPNLNYRAVCPPCFCRQIQMESNAEEISWLVWLRNSDKICWDWEGGGGVTGLKVPKCEILMSWILMIFLSWSLYR